MKNDTRFQQYLLTRADSRNREALEELVMALEAGDIAVGAVNSNLLASNAGNYAGGVNYCPNSDVRFSKMAATDASGTIVPATAGDTNFEAYRFFRQLKSEGAVQSAARALKSATHSLYPAAEGANEKIPIWDRTNGTILLGSTDGLEQYDILIPLYNRDVTPGSTWFVRVSCSVTDDTPLPDALEFYAGLYEVRSGGEGYIEGGNFTLSNRAMPPGVLRGATTYNYKCVAETGSGIMVESNVLAVTDSPAVLSSASFNQLYFSGGDGYVKFRLYRHNPANGQYHLIADVRNSNVFQFDDTGDTSRPVTGFESVGTSVHKAFAQTRNFDAGRPGQARIITNLTVFVGENYDTSQANTFSQYLRIGVTAPTAINRQLIVDKIWLGQTFNDWSDSPFDKFPNIASTSMTSAPVSSGGGSFIPPNSGNGGSCVVPYAPILLLDFDKDWVWRAFNTVLKGSCLESGAYEPNLVLDQFYETVDGIYQIITENGTILPCSAEHPLIRSMDDADGIQAQFSREGLQLYGFADEEFIYTRIWKKTWIPGPFRVGTFRTSGNHHYCAGWSFDRRLSPRGLFGHNRAKNPDGEIQTF